MRSSILIAFKECYQRKTNEKGIGNMELDQSTVEVLAQIIAKYDLTEVDFQSGDTRITVKKAPAPNQIVQSGQVFPAAVNQSKYSADYRRIAEMKALRDEQETTKTTQEKESTAKSSAASGNEGKYVTSPIAGIFYRQSQPGNPPYVEVGQKVRKGDIVCLVEAMKMINEIPANRDGVVREFLVENEQFVEYGVPLVLIEGE